MKERLRKGYQVTAYDNLSSGKEGLMARLYTRVPNEVAYPYVNVGRFSPVKPNLRSSNLFYLGVLNEFKGVDILVDVVRELDSSLVVSLDPAEIAKKMTKVFRVRIQKRWD